MSNTYINIGVIGDGITTYVGSFSSGSVTGSQLISASNTYGSGIYYTGLDHKFLTNKNVLKIIGVGSTIVSSSIDNSFTVQSRTDDTASINVIFSPKMPNVNILTLKPNVSLDSNDVEVFQISYSPSVTKDAFQSGRTLPTELDYKNGYMYRYFYKKTSASRVKEIAKTQFHQLSKSSPSIEIKWKITGNADDVTKINSDILDIADRTLQGIKLLLKRNLLQYWNETAEYVNIQFDVTDIVKTQNMGQI